MQRVAPSLLDVLVALPFLVFFTNACSLHRFFLDGRCAAWSNRLGVKGLATLRIREEELMQAVGQEVRILGGRKH